MIANFHPYSRAFVIIYEASDGLGPLIYGLLRQNFKISYWNPVVQKSATIDANELDLLIQLGSRANVGDS